MKNKKTTKIIIVLMLLLSFNACGVKDDDKIIMDEPGTSITVIDDATDQETAQPVISVEKIDRIEDVQVFDWLDEETVIVSKENTSLEKMSLAELSDSYPRSLYLYNINTKEYKLLKEQKNAFLGEATLSADKKHLLYSEYTLGDPAYYVMNLETKDTFGITGNDIGGAMTARWFGNEVIGAAYNNGAYQASTSGDISAIEGMKDEAVYIIRGTKDHIFYNTSNDDSLVVLNRATKEKKDLNLKQVYDVILSADGTKMLVLQSDSTKSSLILCDLDGSNQISIANDLELSGISWSQDQRMIAYATVNGLYVYDTLTAKAEKIAVDIQNASTVWSPSGEKLVYSQWDGERHSSSIVYLKSSLQSK